VVVDVNKKDIVTIDPIDSKTERKLNKKTFPNIWFDFVGKDNRTVSWGWYMVVSFKKKKFKIKGGYYY